MRARSQPDVDPDHQRPRGWDRTKGIIAGLALTFTGIGAGLVSLFDPPAEPQQRAMAAGVAIFCLILGPAELGTARHGDAFLQRIRPLAVLFRWVPGPLLVAGGYYLIVERVHFGQGGGRINTPAGAVYSGVVMIVFGAAWLVSGLRKPRKNRRD